MTRKKLDPSLLADWWTIAKQTKQVYFVQDHQSRTNMGAAYTLYVVWEGKLWKAWPSKGWESGHGYDEKLAKELGFRRTKKWRSWYRGGCGYDRVHDIVYSMARHFDGFDGLKETNAIRIEGLGDNG